MRRIPMLSLLLLVLAACGSKTRPTATPYPTQTAQPTYTLYPTYTLRPTETPAAFQPRPGWQKAQVLQVVDGDTIEVGMNGSTHRVRYIGIDAPELGDLCYTEATRFNSYLVMSKGKVVYLEKDASEIDRYDRLLRYVWILESDKYTMVNAELVGMGYAVAKSYPPDTKYQSFLAQMEQQAEQAALVLCRPSPTPTLTNTPTVTPTRKAETATPAPTTPVGCPQGCVSPPAGCVIKGNISSSTGERIYHVPGQRYYEQTKIEPDKGERWFCSEEEAVANGWRKSKQ